MSKHVWFTPIGNVALALALKSDFAAQPQVESDLCIFIKYTISMCDNIFVFRTSAFAAQEQGEIDFSI